MINSACATSERTHATRHLGILSPAEVPLFYSGRPKRDLAVRLIREMRLLAFKNLAGAAKLVLIAEFLDLLRAEGQLVSDDWDWRSTHIGWC